MIFKSIDSLQKYEQLSVPQIFNYIVCFIISRVLVTWSETLYFAVLPLTNTTARFPPGLCDGSSRRIKVNEGLRLRSQNIFSLVIVKRKTIHICTDIWRWVSSFACSCYRTSTQTNQPTKVKRFFFLFLFFFFFHPRALRTDSVVCLYVQ